MKQKTFISILILCLFLSGCNKEADNNNPGEDADTAIRIAFVSEEYGHPEIFSMHVDGQARKRLTETLENVQNAQPSVSYSGRSIAFVSDRDGGPNIYVMDSNGENVRQLTFQRIPFYAMSPVWSPDDKQIAFLKTTQKPDSFGKPRSLEIFKIDSDGKNEAQLTTEWEPGPNRMAWHKKDNYIVFITQKWGGVNSAIMIDAGNPEKGQNISAGEQIAYFSFHPDTHLRLLCAGNINGSGFDIYSLEMKPTQDGKFERTHQRLTNTQPEGANSRQPSWSPDGRRILFTSNRSGNEQLYVMAADGSNQNLVSVNKAAEYDPAWFPFTNEQTIGIVDTENEKISPSPTSSSDNNPGANETFSGYGFSMRHPSSIKANMKFKASGADISPTEKNGALLAADRNHNLAL
jgi:TolB protein